MRGSRSKRQLARKRLKHLGKRPDGTPRPGKTVPARMTGMFATSRRGR